MSPQHIRHASQSALRWGLLIATAVTACTAADSPNVDGRNEATLDRLRSAEQGCSFSIPDGKGKRMLDLRGRKLPFQLPAIASSPGQRGTGKVLQTKVTAPGIPTPIKVSCWVPSSFTEPEFVAATASVDWSTIYPRLRHSRYVSPGEYARALSSEMAQYRYEKLGPAPAKAKGMGAANLDLVCNVQEAKGRKDRASLNQSAVSCMCAIALVYDPETQEAYYDVECWMDLGGSAPGSEPLQVFYLFETSTPDELTVIDNLETILCGSLGCYDDQGYTPDYSTRLTLTSSTASVDQGQMVTFSGHVSDISQLTGAQWSWSSATGDLTTTTTGYCPPVADALVCEIPVNMSGTMILEVSTANGTASSWTTVQVKKVGSASADQSQLPPPTCPYSYNSQYSANDNANMRAFCAGTYPSTATKAKLMDALDSVQARGGICATIAQSVRAIVNDPTRFRVYPADSAALFNFGGVTGGQQNDRWMAVSQAWIDIGSVNRDLRGQNLRDVLTHEGDHLLVQLMNNGQVGGTDSDGHLRLANGTIDPSRSLHSDQCGGP